MTKSAAQRHCSQLSWNLCTNACKDTKINPLPTQTASLVLPSSSAKDVLPSKSPDTIPIDDKDQSPVQSSISYRASPTPIPIQAPGTTLPTDVVGSGAVSYIN